MTNAETRQSENLWRKAAEHLAALWLIGVVIGGAGLARQVAGPRTLTALALVAIASAMIALMVAWRRGADRRVRHPALIGLAGLGVAQIISMAFADDTFRGATHTILFCSMALIGWAAMQITPEVARRALISALGALAVIGVYHVIWWMIDIGDGLVRPVSLFPNTNNLGAAMIPAMLLAARDRRWGWLALFGVALLLTASRASMLAVAAAGMVVGAWHLWQGARVPRSVWIAIGIGGLVLLPVIITQFMNGTHGNAALRLDLWQVAVKVFSEHPVVGIGPESYEYAFRQHSQLEHEMVHHHAHNLPLQVAAETGIIGLMALGAALVGGLVAMRRAWLDGNPQVAAMLGAWVVALCVQGMLDYVYWVSGNLLIVVIASWLMAHPTPRSSAPVTRRAVTWAAYGAVATSMFFVYLLWVGLLDEFWPFRYTMVMGGAMAAVFYGIGVLARGGAASRQ